MDFLKGAKDFARNPLGIIALFISLIYGFATLLLNSSAEKLTEIERWPLVIFIVIFPIMVLVTFYKLVTNHHGKLYAPSDFKDDKSFLRTLTAEEQEKKLDKEVKESLESDKLSSESDVSTDTNPLVSGTANVQERNARVEENRRFKEELKLIENAVIEMIASEYNVKADKNVAIGDTDADFDALLKTPGRLIFVEVKALRHPGSGGWVLERLLYNAVIADKFLDSNFKLIIAFVYYFDDTELGRFEKMWRRKVEKCPAEVELRFIPKSKIDG